MNVEFGAEGTLFPEKKYINGIFVAVKVADFLPTGRTTRYLFRVFQGLKLCRLGFFRDQLQYTTTNWRPE
jgi:hypothetical protein